MGSLGVGDPGAKVLPLPTPLPQKVEEQLKHAGLPDCGQVPFVPELSKNRRGETIVKKARIQFGPKKDKVGYVDKDRRIWVRDVAHAGLPDHWDVQIDGGRDYLKVDDQGNQL